MQLYSIVYLTLKIFSILKYKIITNNLNHNAILLVSVMYIVHDIMKMGGENMKSNGFNKCTSIVIYSCRL